MPSQLGDVTVEEGAGLEGTRQPPRHWQGHTNWTVIFGDALASHMLIQPLEEVKAGSLYETISNRPREARWQVKTSHKQLDVNGLEIIGYM